MARPPLVASVPMPYLMDQAWLTKRKPLLLNPKDGELFSELWLTQDKTKKISSDPRWNPIEVYLHDGIPYSCPPCKTCQQQSHMKTVSQKLASLKLSILKLEKESLTLCYSKHECGINVANALILFMIYIPYSWLDPRSFLIKTSPLHLKILRSRGNLVLLPTEWVFSLGCNILNNNTNLLGEDHNKCLKNHSVNPRV